MKKPRVVTRGGAAGGIRTHNLPITRRLLCRLSYDGMKKAPIRYFAERCFAQFILCSVR